MESTRAFKIIVVGASGSGKTAIVNRLVTGNFIEDVQSTVGVEFKSYIIDIDGEKVKLQIWDTAGQERFRSVSRAYFRNAVGALLVYDITSRDSFEEITQWLNDLHTIGHPGAVAFLVGNKTDLEKERKIGETEATEFAAKHNLEFVETSAVSGQNISDLFTRFAYRIASDIKAGTLVPPTVVSKQNGKKEKPPEKKGCC